MTKRPFAVFDIDGTLIRWQLFHAIVHHLGQHGYILRRQHDAIRAARMRWKNRESIDGFAQYEQTLVDVYLEILSQIHPDDHAAIVDEVVGEYRDQVHVFPMELLKDLKTKGYLLFAISGSHHTAVGRVAAHHGFDDWLGADFEVVDNKFTGKVSAPIFDKAAALRQLAEKHNASFGGSYAIGDSSSDIAMLELAENPIAFNPEKNLRSQAIERKWPIVVERKNVVYKLKPAKGGYRLELPNA